MIDFIRAHGIAFMGLACIVYALRPFPKPCGCTWLMACRKHSAEFDRIDQEIRGHREEKKVSNLANSLTLPSDLADYGRDYRQGRSRQQAGRS